ncbi:MAG: pyridoxamine 5'-phosphate oxidase family protein [Anaerolineales bacterium]|nr:pyridoxamine 5'-phosphate oxidase family protein [Anaerolineales bacterium]
MKPTKITRPTFPPGYVDNPTSEVSWDYVTQQLTEAKNYWLCSTRPDGRPHVVPRWAVYVDGKIYYDGSSETRHARNIVENPHVSLHLESGDQVVILEGTARPAEKPSLELGRKLAQAYQAKYTAHGYAPEPNQWDEGGLYVFTIRKAITWTNFMADPTKFVFEGILE